MRVLRPVAAVLLVVGVIAATVERTPAPPSAPGSIAAADADEDGLSEIDLPSPLPPDTVVLASSTCAPVAYPLLVEARDILASAPKTSPPRRA